MIDAATFSKSSRNGSNFSVSFVDWIPGIFSTLGMIVINSLDKTRLSADSFYNSGDGVAWKARVVLFMGFAALAGGLAGSVTVMVLKYVLENAVGKSLWFGVANVMANALIMLRYVVMQEWDDRDSLLTLLLHSCVTLWVSQNMEDDYTYNLAL